MTAPCPTPAKARYATRETAEYAADQHKIAYNKLLHPYRCCDACGWWHLTSNDSQPADVAGVQSMSDAAFRRLVLADAENHAPWVNALALRDGAVVPRWIRAIRDIQYELTQEELPLAGRKDGAPQPLPHASLPLLRHRDRRASCCSAGPG